MIKKAKRTVMHAWGVFLIGLSIYFLLSIKDLVDLYPIAINFSLFFCLFFMGLIQFAGDTKKHDRRKNRS